MRRRLLRIAVVGALVLAVLGAGLFAFARSERALLWAVQQISSAVERAGGRLEFEQISGSLFGALRAQRVSFEQAGTRAVLTGVEIEPSLRALWQRELVLQRIAVGRLEIDSAPSNEPMREPASLALPIEVRVDSARIDVLRWRSGETQVELTQLGFAWRGGAREHALDGLRLRWAAVDAQTAVDLQASATVDATAPFALRGTLRAAAPGQAVAEAAVSGRLGALELSGTLLGDGRFRSLKATLDAHVAPFAPEPLTAARVRSEGLNLAAWFAAAPQTALDIELKVKGGSATPLVGQIAVRNQQPGSLGQRRLPMSSMASGFTLDAAARRLQLTDIVADLSGGGHITGGAELLGRGEGGRWSSDWQLALNALDLSALDTRLVPTRLDGRAVLAINAQRQRFDVTLDQRGMQLQARGAHDGAQITLEQMLLRTGPVAGTGEASGRAQIALAGERAVQAELQLRAFDPARLLAQALPAADARAAGIPDAALTGKVNVRGVLQPAWLLQVDADLAPSRIAVSGRTFPVQGRLRGRISAQRIEQTELALAVGRNRFGARGAFGAPGDTLEVSIDAQEPGLLLPGLTGQIGGALSLSGALRAPAATFALKGTRVAVQGATVGAMTTRGTVRAEPALPGAPPLIVLDTELDARTIEAGGLRLTQLAARVAGSSAKHTLNLSARGNALDTRVVLEGQWVRPLAPALVPAGGGRAASASARVPSAAARAPVSTPASAPASFWRGRVLEARNAGAYPMALSAAAPLEFGVGRLRFGPAQATVGDGRLQVDTLEWQPGQLVSRGSLAAFPVGTLADLFVARSAAGTPEPFASTLRMAGEWSLAQTPRLNGRLQLRRESGDVVLGATPPFALGLSRVELDAQIVEDRLQVQARAQGAAAGEATAALSLDPSPRLSLNSPMTLRADLALRTLRPFGRYLGALADVDGSLNARVEGDGTLGKPRISASVRGERLRADAPQYGLSVRDGRLDAQLAGGVFEVRQFEARAGEGTFTAKGSLPMRPGLSVPPLTWRAERLSLLTRPDRRMVVDGDGTLVGDRGRLILSGRVRAREGYVEFARATRTRLGDDVVVLGRTTAPASVQAGRSPFGIRLDLDFGDAFRIVGSGLDAMITGRIALVSADDGTLSARGKVSTARGTFNAFGQRLDVDRGTLLFNGPLDNPGIDALALRRLSRVEVGVEITGNARVPRVRITSNPPMSQGEQLSWLVLGRGLDGASQADAAMIAGIAASVLGGEDSVPITRRIAQSFGLDDIGVRRDGGAFGGQVLSLGKRLSDRVYVAYEQAVNATTNLLRVDLELHQFISLRAEAGAVSGFGIFYTRSLR
jgi:translocation and assembly module TamB